MIWHWLGEFWFLALLILVIIVLVTQEWIIPFLRKRPKVGAILQYYCNIGGGTFEFHVVEVDWKKGFIYGNIPLLPPKEAKHVDLECYPYCLGGENIEWRYCYTFIIPVEGQCGAHHCYIFFPTFKLPKYPNYTFVVTRVRILRK